VELPSDLTRDVHAVAGEEYGVQPHLLQGRESSSGFGAHDVFDLEGSQKTTATRDENTRRRGLDAFD
jgi:hypothetical protein